jgi:hypothetical protein
MLVENAFHLCVELLSRVTTLILQLHLDVELELVPFGEYHYHKNCNKSLSQSSIHNSCDWTDHSDPDKYRKNALNLVMAGHCP